jgi:hypothetical protein
MQDSTTYGLDELGPEIVSITIHKRPGPTKEQILEGSDEHNTRYYSSGFR